MKTFLDCISLFCLVFTFTNQVFFYFLAFYGPGWYTSPGWHTGPDNIEYHFPSFMLSVAITILCPVIGMATLECCDE